MGSGPVLEGTRFRWGRWDGGLCENDGRSGDEPEGGGGGVVVGGGEARRGLGENGTEMIVVETVDPKYCMLYSID